MYKPKYEVQKSSPVPVYADTLTRNIIDYNDTLQKRDKADSRRAGGYGLLAFGTITNISEVFTNPDPSRLAATLVLGLLGSGIVLFNQRAINRDNKKLENLSENFPKEAITVDTVVSYRVTPKGK